ncbi:MAG: uroporphyrinogen-III C-methyltransferase [Bacteroidaceae bacterium]|nr:uroporphyrinogen-III C-methyltransferase [Bacteroidaceae bacterium]
MDAIKVIARGSKLSRIQVGEVFDKYPQLSYQVEWLESYGDQHKEISLLNGEAPADIFTRELDKKILDGAADIAIHSAKDLPYPLPRGIEVVALLPPFDTTDALVSRQHLPFRQLPSGSRIGTSSPLRRRELLHLRSDIEVVSLRGTIEERVRQVHDGKMDAAIVATCALKRLGMSDEITEILPFATHPLQGYLAITACKGREDLKALFASHSVLQRQGTVTLVGFGPGDPELLTVKGIKALEKADLILYDDLIDKDFLLRFRAEKKYVGKRAGAHHAEQEDINLMLLQAARKGQEVVRLKGGDPMIFGHTGEEIEFLQSNLVSVSVIPGITAASALAARARVPLTHRWLSSSVGLRSGHGPSQVFAPYDGTQETLVYYMGAAQLQQIAQNLMAHGWPGMTPALLGYNLSRSDEQLWDTTLAQLAQTAPDYPTPLLALIGQVAGQRNASADRLRLTLYTGVRCPGPRFLHTPLIELLPVEDENPIKEAIRALPTYQYILFTSRHAVHHWFRHLDDVSRLGHATIVSIGPSTTEALREHGIEHTTEAHPSDSYGVTDTFRELLSTHRPQTGAQRVLIPRSDKALSLIPDGLSQLGYEVSTVTVYHNRMPQNVQRVNLNHIGCIVFTSPSTVDNFMRLYGHLPTDKQYMAQGRITQEYLKTLGIDAKLCRAENGQSHP